MITVPVLGLPGEELIQIGCVDAARGHWGLEALLVSIGAPRLRGLGIPVPDDDKLPAQPEMVLYRLLEAELGDGAHSAYNAWIRRLVSYERGLELERRQAEQRD